MTQKRLNSLSVLNINCYLTRRIDFNNIIREFARKQAAFGCDFYDLLYINLF